MKNFITAIIIVSFVSACGRGPRDIKVSTPVDQKLSCEKLEEEMTRTRVEAGQMLLELEAIGGKNAGLYVASWFTLLAPLLFLDVRMGQYQDLKVLRDRYAHLETVRVSKSCDFVPQNLEEYENQILEENNIKIKKEYPNSPYARDGKN